MAKDNTFQQDSGAASAAKGERAGSKSKRRHAPVVLEITLRPGVLSWLRSQACRLNNELGTRAITPAHIAHQLIRNAQWREMVDAHMATESTKSTSPQR